MRHTIDAMVSSGMRDAGYQYINLDAGWAAPFRTPEGDLIADPFRFPNGVKPLVDYAHARGLKFGLYNSPFNQTCGQDPRIGSVGHEKRDAATFASWGIDYLKYDWCREEADHDEQVRVFAAMGEALRDSGRHIIYSINPNSSDDPTAGGRLDWWGIADLVRTSGDLVPVWRNALPPQGPDDPFASGIFKGIPDQFQSAATAPARGGYRGDPDMLVVGLSWSEFFLNHADLLSQAVQSRLATPEQLAQFAPVLANPRSVQWIATAQPSLTDDEQRSHFSLWAMLAAPLIAGNDLRSMSTTTLSILSNREVIAVDQDPLFIRAHAIGDDRRIWAKPMADGSVTVALFNAADAIADLSATTDDVGLPAAPCYTARDLWAHTSETVTGTLEAKSLSPHAVRLLRVSVGCSH
ncbi:glycoside hydrolase family 27 protein [Mycobacterium sp. DL592]|uniref:glycoside hydrolase family 27 protein n=1 Tax=Mycobacterium sp. DL592 TaxID=2675524 RepID=UPI001FB9FAAE|nr:glycoside hydrolase family 27 protein [Mycobacterium sp. DL592]